MKTAIKTILKIILFPFKVLSLLLIYFYKGVISPLLPHTCRFEPTCSSYAITAFKRFNIFKALSLTFKRIIRCNPKNKGGLDRVPDNIKGDIKWLL